MKTNKLKIILIALCYIIIPLFSNIQCAEEEYNRVSEGHQSVYRNLHRIDHGDMNIDDKLAKSIAIGIKYNANLWYVDLNLNHITETGITYLAMALKNKPIVQFHLSGNKIGDQGHILLAEAIKTWSGLAILDLTNTDLGDLGAEALGNALKDKRNITTFNFNVGHKLSPEGKKNFLSKLTNTYMSS